ncbi:class I SAM-dependent methyltransferase [Gaetbulibacter aestuarii]|uniref:Class I SAM-dependent methyltransferase n=1 Tax=Gaetbulibacter aestuarii TaxID=1502358 RepID=A0ABW7MUV2_9FLAO
MTYKPTDLHIKDHSVSGELFRLKKNERYGFLETVPAPGLKKLPEYYESEDYISHTDAKRNLFEKAYHAVREFSVKQKLNLISKYATSGKQLLDVGCGTGDFLKKAQNDQWTVFGIEPNEKARAIANQKTGQAVFNSEQLFKFEKNKFDVITLWHVLEHLPDLENQLQQFHELLKPNGILIIAIPNYKSFDAEHYQTFWAAYDVPRHLWHFDRTSIKRIADEFQFKLLKIKPMWFDAFYVSLLSEKYKTGKMNPVKAIWIGFLSNFKAFFTKEASSLIYILKKH